MHEESLEIKVGPEPALGRALEVLSGLLRQQGISSRTILGSGVGVPGLVEFRTGRPVSPPIMPGWDGFRVVDFFRKHFTCPVFVDNDVNVMAVGEHWAAKVKAVDNFIFIKIGTGIGAGITCHGRIYRGGRGWAGDVGHIMADPAALAAPAATLAVWRQWRQPARGAVRSWPNC